jgi:2-succinyl-5-enolpyruvyl-6-hydroxy-3-cyclohexene-1-carboxylate synthase
MAQQSRKPVAVVCTSGSALLNYYPAIAEAYYSDIPLVVITADRPAYKIDIGDGQTIRQENVFQNHIGYSANLMQDNCHATEKIINPVETQSAIQRFNDHHLNEALNTALKTRSPVHINVPFEEPLYDTVKANTVKPNVESPPEDRPPELDELTDIAGIWNSSKRKMILVGTNPPETLEQHILDTLAGDSSVLVFTETTSNLHHADFFPSIDSIIAPLEKSPNKDENFRALQPDILLTFGGMIVSKKIKAFLRDYVPEFHWHVDPRKANDTFFSLSHHFRTDANTFFKRFLKLTKPVKSDFYGRWSEVRKDYIEKRRRYLNEIPFSDMLVFSRITTTIPRDYQVQLGNSSTVRYSQLFDADPALRVFCNRGTSGIDGSTSTAIGASLHDKSPTVLLTGDLSFLYDSNGLWNNYIRPDFRIIVINNGGGGIFRILPGKEDTANFENYFETVQNLNIDRLCSLYGIKYLKAENESDLNNALAKFYKKSDAPKLLEVRTPRLTNDKILLAYFDFLS